jgi:hypothetical protein
VDGVSDAYNAFISRPKPVSDQYTKIENAIRKIAMDSLGADEEDLADKLEITKMDFANGVYSVELKMDREDESPLLTMPTKLIEELRGLDIVQNVKYEGYTIEKEQTEGEEEKPVFDEDGNQTGTEGGTEAGEKEVVKMSLTITVKGGKLDMSQFQTEEAEAEAEAEANGEAAQ